MVSGRSKQTSIDTHTHAQCSHASVGLVQAHPNHMSNSCKCMGVDGEALHLRVVYKKTHFFATSHTRICISTTVTCAASERTMKLKVRMIKSLSP